MSDSSKPNPMKVIRLEKVVLNMGVGRSGAAIETAQKALEQIANKKPTIHNSKSAQRDWGVRKGEPIGVSVTLRRNAAVNILKRLFEAKGNVVKSKSFDNFGNYSFGIHEHIDIPEVKYDPKIGILGLDVSVILTRPGFGIRLRSRHKARIGKGHTISSQEAEGFLVEKFGVETA